MPETTPLIKAALNLRVGAGFDVYINSKHKKGTDLSIPSHSYILFTISSSSTGTPSPHGSVLQLKTHCTREWWNALFPLKSRVSSL